MIKSKLKKNLKVKNAKEFSIKEWETIDSLLKIVEDNENDPPSCVLSLEKEIKSKAALLGSGVFATAWNKDGLVIKLSTTQKSYVIPRVDSGEYKYFAPTVSCNINKHTDGYFTFLIFQKKCDTKDRKNDVLYFYDRFPESRYDIHDENIGRYKNKRVIFDC